MSKIEGQIRIPSGCAIAAVLSREGRLMTGETIIESMKPMHDRSNGLGGGFAAYGIYPEYRDFFALHLFLEDRAARKNCEAFLRETHDPTENQIREALSGNLCRCTGYQNIVAAISLAARRLREGTQP